jgi:hypothetical protein
MSKNLQVIWPCMHGQEDETSNLMTSPKVAKTIKCDDSIHEDVWPP